MEEVKVNEFFGHPTLMWHRQLGVLMSLLILQTHLDLFVNFGKKSLKFLIFWCIIRNSKSELKIWCACKIVGFS